MGLIIDLCIVLHLQELFQVNKGKSLFAIVNGRCVDDPKSRASDLTSNSLLGLEIASNRDIIGIALANLIVSFSMFCICHLILISSLHSYFIHFTMFLYEFHNLCLKKLQRLHWKRASRLNHGLMLTTPLRHVDYGSEKSNKFDDSNALVLRPQDLR